MIAVKNVSHPNMFPIAGESVAIAAAEAAPRQKAAVAEAPADDVSAAPAPTSAWANPLSKLRPSAVPGEETKHTTRADEAIAYLRAHGPSSPGDLCKAMGITSKGGVTPFINGALKDGRIVRVDGKYSIGGEAAAKPDTEPKAAPEAIAHFEATTAIVAGRKKAKSVAPANLPVAPSEAAAAIAAMRQSAEPEAETPQAKDEPPPLPAPVPPTSTGRKPEFVVFVGDIQLLSWPDGDITIQTENSTVELSHQHFRALITLVELRGGFSVVSRRL